MFRDLVHNAVTIETDGKTYKGFICEVSKRFIHLVDLNNKDVWINIYDISLIEKGIYSDVSVPVHSSIKSKLPEPMVSKPEKQDLDPSQLDLYQENNYQPIFLAGVKDEFAQNINKDAFPKPKFERKS